MKVEIIKCLKDNYSYLIIDENNQKTCIVDPTCSEFEYETDNCFQETEKRNEEIFFNLQKMGGGNEGGKFRKILDLCHLELFQPLAPQARKFCTPEPFYAWETPFRSPKQGKTVSGS